MGQVADTCECGNEVGNWLPMFCYYILVSFSKVQATRLLLGVFNLEYGTDSFSRNITNQLPT